LNSSFPLDSALKKPEAVAFASTRTPCIAAINGSALHTPGSRSSSDTASAPTKAAHAPNKGSHRVRHSAPSPENTRSTLITVARHQGPHELVWQFTSALACCA
jgi:hypothetical protein